jgi:hypothetical protein
VWKTLEPCGRSEKLEPCGRSEKPMVSNKGIIKNRFNYYFGP